MVHSSESGLMERDHDYVLCECDLEPLKAFGEGLEPHYHVTIIKEPSVCLTMLRAEDSLDKQEFYLGEALTTECQVSVDGRVGYGVCLGDEPVRGYCLAVIDALSGAGAPSNAKVQAFIARHRQLISARETEEFNLILRTQVDFKLMEEE